MRILSAAALLAGFPLALACGDVPVEPDPADLPVVWSPVSLGSFPAGTGMMNRMRTVIRTQPEWVAFWAQVYPPERTWMPTPPPPPEIDFRRELVVVAMMGATPTTGYSLRITDVRSLPDHMDVHVETVGGTNCGNALAVLYPRAVIRVSPRREEVRFVEEVLPCR